jgi:hypothetical protein
MRAAAFFAILLSACSAYDDLALLEVERVEPSEIESGGTLRIYGRGFPLAHTPDVLLHGLIYRPGTPQGTLDAHLSGQVESESLIKIPVSQDLIAALGGRASFDGELRVGFRTADGHRDVFAAQRVRIDFLPDTSSQLLGETGREARADQSAAQSFGVTLSREELGTVGVRVLSVEPDSLAATQGVEPNDVLVGLDGWSLYGWRDFEPDPSRTESSVLVTREGLRGVHLLRWPHEVTERPIDPIALGLFAMVGLLLGWLSPAVLCLRPKASRLSLAAWLVRSSLVLTLATVLVSVSALQWTSIWILALGTFAALFTLANRQRSGALSFAFSVVATLTVMLLARSASTSAIIAAQGPDALRWYLFQTPASLLAFGAYLHALGMVSSRASLTASLYASAAAVLGAVLFLGGWPLVGSLESIAILVAKSAAIMLASLVFSMNPRTASACAALGLAMAALGLIADLGAFFPQWSALAVGSVCALVLRALAPPLRRESAPALV